MKKPLLICILLCSLFTCGCGTSPAKPSLPSISSSHPKSDPLKEYKTQKEIEAKFYEEIPEDLKDYIASSTQGISLMLLDGKLSVTIRVTILPDAIPMVADAICPIILKLTSEYDIKSFRASFRYYTESNADGIDKSTFVEWHTEDGKNGTFVNSSGLYKMTLDELFEFYNNFGKDN